VLLSLQLMMTMTHAGAFTCMGLRAVEPQTPAAAAVAARAMVSVDGGILTVDGLELMVQADGKTLQGLPGAVVVESVTSSDGVTTRRTWEDAARGLRVHTVTPPDTAPAIAAFVPAAAGLTARTGVRDVWLYTRAKWMPDLKFRGVLVMRTHRFDFASEQGAPVLKDFQDVMQTPGGMSKMGQYFHVDGFSVVVQFDAKESVMALKIAPRPGRAE